MIHTTVPYNKENTFSPNDFNRLDVDVTLSGGSQYICNHPTLEHPIVIPQRRPGSKERGFILAYPPDLQRFNISRETFLDFMQACNKAVQGNGALMAVSVAGFGASLAPNAIAMVVGAAVQFGAVALNTQVIRWKTNTFLDKYNEDLFAPRGLMCFVSVHESFAGERLTGEKQPGTSVIGHFSAGSASTPRRNLQDPFRHQGTLDDTQGCAPLIYLPDSAERDPPASDSKHGRSFRKAWSGLNNYLDRRAQVTYAAENPTDRLTSTQAPTEHMFRNRYLDPRHPAVNNGLVGLISGGAITRDPEKRKNRKREELRERIERERGEYTRRLEDVSRQSCSSHERERQMRQYEEEFQSRTKHERQALEDLESGVTNRKIKKDILYLTIVPLPDSAQLHDTQVNASKLDDLPPVYMM